LSNNHTLEPEDGALNNGSSAALIRREARAHNITGELSLPSTLDIERYSLSGTFDFEQMLLSLHDLFEQDRQVATQADATRCGICYLHFHLSELQFREEGYYICQECERNLGNQRLTMVRKQQKL